MTCAAGSPKWCWTGASPSAAIPAVSCLAWSLIAKARYPGAVFGLLRHGIAEIDLIPSGTGVEGDPVKTVQLRHDRSQVQDFALKPGPRLVCGESKNLPASFSHHDVPTAGHQRHLQPLVPGQPGKNPLQGVGRRRFRAPTEIRTRPGHARFARRRLAWHPAPPDDGPGKGQQHEHGSGRTAVDEKHRFNRPRAPESNRGLGIAPPTHATASPGDRAVAAKSLDSSRSSPR